MITVTTDAAEQIRRSAENAECVGVPLRIIVVSAGCCGSQYQLGFDNPTKDDATFESNGITLVVDPGSLPQVRGLELDFEDGEEGSEFVFRNPNAGGGCGCGHSAH